MTRTNKILAAVAFAAAALTGIACSGEVSSKAPEGSSFTPTEAAASPTGLVVLAGTLLVGKDIAPGTYQGTATGMCYVARLRAEANEFGSDIISNDLFSKGDKVTFVVKASDYAVKIDRDCGLAK